MDEGSRRSPDAEKMDVKSGFSGERSGRLIRRWYRWKEGVNPLQINCRTEGFGGAGEEI
jgi:hypothetical protein